MKKIPDNARCVFRGKIHHVYQWQQKTFDGSIVTFECLKRKPTVTVLAVTQDKKVIVTVESQPLKSSFIGLPGGCAETDSLLIEAKRELFEETGYQSSNWTFFKKIDVLSYSKLVWDSYFYIAKDCKFVSEQKLDSGEKIRLKFLDFDDFVDITQKKNFDIDYISNFVRGLLGNQDEMKKFKRRLLD